MSMFVYFCLFKNHRDKQIKILLELPGEISGCEDKNG